MAQKMLLLLKQDVILLRGILYARTNHTVVSILVSNSSDSFFALNLPVLSLHFCEFFNFKKRRFQECYGLTLVGMS